MLSFSETPLVPKGDSLFAKTIQSNMEELSSVSEDLFHILRTRLCLSEREIILSRVCFEEAIHNAIIHGNLAVAKSRVRIRLGLDGDRMTFSVRDEGHGFSPDELPEVNGDHLFAENGRGVFMMEHFMDKVVFYDCGATLYMEKKINLDN